MRNPLKFPRKAYCTGCGITFEKHHLKMNHRRTFRCGGRFLSIAEMHTFNSIRRQREELERIRRVTS